MATLIWVLIAIVAVAAIALVVARKRRTAMLRDRFGPEYDRTVENRDGRRAAEAELRAREKQRAHFDVKQIPEATRLRFADEWRDVQENFIDEPAQAAAAADTLITRVMKARGYPMTDFDVQADLVSVDHPQTVENYRFAHAVQERSQIQQASTEDLREALLRYRSLFDDLRPDGNGAASGTTSEAQPAGASSRQRVAAAPEPADLETSAAGHTNSPAGLGIDGTDPSAPDPDYYGRRTGQ